MSHTKYMTVAWFAWGGGGSESYLGEKKTERGEFWGLLGGGCG